MKYPIYTLIALLTCTFPAKSLAQGYTIKGVVNEKFRTADASYDRLDAGTIVELSTYRIIAGAPMIRANVNGQKRMISAFDLEHLDFQVNDLSTDGVWYLQFLTSSALDELSKRGWDSGVRRALQEEYLSFNETITLFDDPYLEDYLNQIRLKLFPKQPIDKHPAVMRIRVYASSEPGTFACANGDLFISTGLLSTLQSEDELIALLAQDFAHIQFNHSVENYRRNLSREARAVFWSQVLTAAAALTEVAVANQSIQNGTFSPVDLYAFGAFTESISLLSTSIAFKIANRLGMEYTPEQEEEADRAAKMLLQNLQADEQALLSAYTRIYEAQKNSRTFELQTQEEHLYPHLYRQMINLGYENNYKLPAANSAYINATAMARRNTAWQTFLNGNYERTQQLLTTQLDADAAVLEDYMLQSVLLRQTSNSAGDMQRAMLLLRKAEQEAYALSPEIHLEKAMVLLRLDEKEGARRELENYRNALKETGEGDNQGNRMTWVTQMLEKLSREK
ncbi:MAG: M48 family metalloprotease [Phaeodactylibacter sp.]|uniref:M48 family metalloprotease n=1 Tax=Phaeodactylibacter sp. TaxID=1940289 RepID=UPI0032EAD0AC